MKSLDSIINRRNRRGLDLSVPPLQGPPRWYRRAVARHQFHQMTPAQRAVCGWFNWAACWKDQDHWQGVTRQWQNLLALRPPCP